ncbi:unnamed protein product, partial [Laminaria digitata]
DLTDLDVFFDKQSDWRDVAVSSSSEASAAAMASSAPAASRKRGPAAPEGDDLASQLVAGLGLNVVPSARGRNDEREGEEGEQEEEEEEVGFGGLRLGGADEREDGVRALMRAIRKEEKNGRSAEKVVAMAVSAAERDGVRDDDLFSFALKSLARMGRLDLSMRVNEMRERYLDDDELENHDRMTTAGLAVACLRAGEETSGLEFLESAVKPGAAATAALAAAAATSAGDGVHKEALHEQRGGDEGGEEEEEEEEDWELLEAEEEQEEILEAEGEVLPELLGYYLDRVEKERSQEAAAGVRKTINRALRKGDFAAAPSPPAPTQPPSPLSVGVYNDMIRRLGKVDRLSDVFEVLDGMTALGVESDHETLEFVTNAAVKEVEFETRAVSMKSLPNGNAALPEVVFVGRSNVGKSSLVNMLVNRKALAPTSAVPGFTQVRNAAARATLKHPFFSLLSVDQ